ncbi:uncharacterized protein LOC127832681 isoform X2 [Dreissena polymorpha]|uniref:uncharacterized protein LOC127832681 isoform X2 n=1 Tax=Dreissena polymorpha TaxID=45954 RepID=UPI0022652208|nr:uncharacterized protein LOC127832681 isoform X2 [Dreissena polymorpha]
MAMFSQSTIEKGSDMVQDFLCSTCEYEKLDEMADYYCESCVKFYCQKCICMHSQLFKKHSTHGRGDMKKWPVAKKVEDFLLKCDVHKDENLDMFCKDHCQLCCTNCKFLYHRQCKMVPLISDLVKKNPTDLKKLSVTIQTFLKEIKNLQDQQETCIQSVQSSYDEQLQKIQETRKQINAALDLLEKNTLKEMKETLTKLQASLRGDIDKCASLQGELKQLCDAIQDISDKSMLELSFVASIKCQEKIKQSETYLKKNFALAKSSIAFEPNSDIVQYLTKLSGLGRIEHSAQTLPVQYLTKLSGLGRIEYSAQTLPVQRNPHPVIRLNSKYEYNASIQSDLDNCCITAICVLPDILMVLVVDYANCKVKLLDQQYKVVDHCIVSDWPKNMCQISPTEVAVTVDGGTNHEIWFITVNNNQLVTNRKLQLQHICGGIAHYQGDLFVTSGTALYKYSMSGKLVSKLHEGKSDGWTGRCAVSPTGDKLYVANPSNHKLLTLASDGSVLASFKDPDLNYPTGLHVTPAGQVLLCGAVSCTILQVNSEGSKKLATLATERDGLQNPSSVCYNINTASIIVGQEYTNNILVYKVL